MMARDGVGRLVFVGAMLGAVGGCATPRMAPPADVVDATETLTTTGRKRASGALVNESFQLGEYDVANVDRKSEKSRGVGVGPWSRTTKTNGFTYELVAGERKLAGKCAAKSSSQGIGSASGSINWGSLEMACSCDDDDGKAELAMTGDERWLKVMGEEYTLEPIYALENGKKGSNPSGFRADNEDKEVLGAVEVVHPGQVWVKKGIDEAKKAKVACVFAGLMLYQPPSDD